MIQDILIGLVNIFGWGLKPLLEKKGIENTTYFIFANTRYIVTAIISVFIILICKRSYVAKHININTKPIKIL